MAKRIVRIILGILVVLVFLGGLLAWISPSYLRREAKKSFPVVDGELKFPELDGQVRIYRDGYGVPQIFATTHHDLFFSQGYVHAQDRFWQMDLWRHTGAGRLSEMVGKPMLETDKFLRTLGWERVSRQELELLGPDELAILEAYSAGVNAYLKDHTGTELSLEYSLLRLLNSDYQVQPWTPLNSLTWGKAMAWDLRGNLDAEIDRAKLLKTLPRNQVKFIYPAYPADHPLIIPAVQSDTEEGSKTVPAPFESVRVQIVPSNHEIITLLEDVERSTALLDRLTGGGFEGIGSNSWAIHGDLTDTGKPYLANDPHLAAQMPSIWYEVGLHCIEKTETCRLDLTGFSFAGVPGVVIGHNDRIAWGFTNLGPDVMDLYIEKVNPEQPTYYQTAEGWIEMETVIEVIDVAGDDPVEHTVQITSHGPVIGSVYGLDDFDQATGLAVPNDFALALRWTALEPSCVFCSIWKINLAQNWDEFRQAASEFAVPAQNLIYADVDGNIGYQMPGRIPIRIAGHDGTLPVPGWNGEYEWQGYIPFEELPHSLNPEAGYIITANNAVVGAEYPYLISEQWNHGFRARRIEDLLNDAPKPINIPYIKRMQGDNYDAIAAILVPEILQLQVSDPDLLAGQELLSTWDYQADLDSGEAALFMVFWQNLIQNTFEDNLPDDFQLGLGSSSKELIRQLVGQPENAWWDDPATPEREIMDDILSQTLQESYRQLEKKLGKDPQVWSWGELHTITFRNQVMNSFPIVKNIFNQGPFPTSGGNEIVNATGWDQADPYQVDWLPSMRMIVDLSDLSNSLTIHTTGQSGHAAHPHYIDMADLWRKIYYHPMLWDLDHIQRQAEAVLILSP